MSVQDRLRIITRMLLGAVLIIPACQVHAQAIPKPSGPPELHYHLVPDFLKLPPNVYFQEVSGVAVNSRGHVFVFQRGAHPLVEFDENGNFVRTMGEGLFSRPHGLRIDTSDNIWVTDNKAHFVLKLSREGRVLMVLGQQDHPGSDHGHFDGPDDIAFGKAGEIYVADGENNSRIVKFDRDGHFLKEWGQKGSEKGKFSLPHTIVTDSQGRVYVGDRENARIQVFDADGNFRSEWTGVGYPYGLFVAPNQHVYMADAEASKILELDDTGRILGSFGTAGRGPGQFAGAHAVAVTPSGQIFVAEVFNWRVEKFVPTEQYHQVAAPSQP